MNFLKVVLIISLALLESVALFAQQQSKVELYIESGHTERIVMYEFDPSGRLLVTLGGRHERVSETDGRKLPGWRGIAKIWNVSSATQLRSIEIPSTGGFETAHLTPQRLVLRANILAVWFSDEVVRIFDVIHNREIPVERASEELMSSLKAKTRSKAQVELSIDGEPIFETSEYTSSCRLADGSPDDFVGSSNDPDNYKYRIRLSGNRNGSKYEHQLGSDTLPAGQLVAADKGRIITTAGYEDELINIWNLSASRIELMTLENGNRISAITASSDLKYIAAGVHNIKVFDAETGRIHGELVGHTGDVWDLQFSQDGRFLISVASDARLIIWNLATMSVAKQIDCLPEEHRGSVAIDETGSRFATGGDSKLTVWNTWSGQIIREVSKELPYYARDRRMRFVADDGLDPDQRKLRFFDRSKVSLNLSKELVISKSANSELAIIDADSEKPVARLISPEKGVAVVAGSDGRFDTNKSLDVIKGLHWIVNDEILKPVPLEAFMRHYYEPNLLARVIKCNNEGTCHKEFKPLPPIGAINRVQSGVRASRVNRPR